MEEEANYFAMCLLMPEDWFVEDVRKYCPNGLDIVSEPAIKVLAKRYQVSEQMVLLRIDQLKKEIWRK